MKQKLSEKKNIQKTKNFPGFNGTSSHTAAPVAPQTSAFVSESNFSSVFGNTEPVGM